MNFKYLIASVLIVVGAILTFGTKVILKMKSYEDEEHLQRDTYIIKITGMWLVVIGAVAIFVLGGSFGA